MSYIHKSQDSPNSRKPASGYVGALLLMAYLYSESVHAEDAAAFRARVIKEVLLEVSDLELAKQIVEIRLNREFLNPLGKATKPPIKPPPSITFPLERQDKFKKTFQSNAEGSLANPVKSDSKTTQPPIVEWNVKSANRANETYVNVGNRIVIGYAHPIGSDFSLRADVAGSSTRVINKSIDNNQFNVVESNSSLGAYLDWFPQGGNFKLSLGINANRMQTRLQTVQGTTANINGKTFNAGTEVLDINYKFPLYTPYFGLGYQSEASDDGWIVYGDLGLMFGRYDAHVRTSMIESNAVTAADVDKEVNILRANLFKGSYVPVGSIGIKYRY